MMRAGPVTEQWNASEERSSLSSRRSSMCLNQSRRAADATEIVIYETALSLSSIGLTQKKRLTLIFLGIRIIGCFSVIG